jgi:hypothetical protein
MELLDSLLYVVKTGADIAYAVSRIWLLYLRAKESTIKDMQALFRILAYLYSTRLLGIKLKPIHSNKFVLKAWCDASYALHPDGKSHSSYSFRDASGLSGMFYAPSSNNHWSLFHQPRRRSLSR